MLKFNSTHLRLATRKLLLVFLLTASTNFLPTVAAEPANPVTESSDSIGRIALTGKQAGFDKEHNFYVATGDAILTIGGQDSKLTADTIEYELKSGIVTARGGVKVTRSNDLCEGSCFKFNISSPDYLITRLNTVLTDPAGNKVNTQFNASCVLKHAEVLNGRPMILLSKPSVTQ